MQSIEGVICPMPVTTPGRLLIEDALPSDIRVDQPWDVKTMREALRQLGERHPDKYRDVTYKLLKIATKVGTSTGGESFSVDHMETPEDVREAREQLRKQVRRILEDDRLTDEQRQQKIIETVGTAHKAMSERLYEIAKTGSTPLYRQVISGARGSKSSLMSLLAGDLLYADAHGNPIPLPVLHSYAEGLSPAEYWAGAYGARQGVIANKFATQEAGFFGKQLAQVAHRLVVTALDSDKEDDAVRGLPTSVDDPDNEGALLAAPAGGFPRNTILTPKVLGVLRQKGVKNILVRSVIANTAPDGGLYARDVGVREYGRLPGQGEAVGMVAAQAVSEPVSQGQLNAKHAGGVALGGAKTVTGFAAINQLFQVPKTYKGGAAHAQVDGRVDEITDAPAGGKYVHINGQKHYVARGFDLKVKQGDTVEAGDVLSEGLPNPAEVVRHKGIGEGRRYFLDVSREVLKNSGISASRRNLELLAKGLINHVRLHDEMEGYVPDDVVPYDVIERKYVPRPGAADVPVQSAVGQYLERPYLHYSIGTKIRPSVVKTLAEYGISSVHAHRDPPPFEPDMIRAMENLQHDPDWMTRLYGSNLKRGLLSAVHRGAASNESGTSFVPGLARGVEFGLKGKVVKPKNWPLKEQRQPEPVSAILAEYPEAQ